MGWHVVLLKEYENEDVVVYQFGPNEQLMGRIKFDKKSEIIFELDPVPVTNDSPTPNLYFKIAATRLAICVKEGISDLVDDAKLYFCPWEYCRNGFGETGKAVFAGD